MKKIPPSEKLRKEIDEFLLGQVGKDEYDAVYLFADGVFDSLDASNETMHHLSIRLI